MKMNLIFCKVFAKSLACLRSVGLDLLIVISGIIKIIMLAERKKKGGVGRTQETVPGLEATGV